MIDEALLRDLRALLWEGTELGVVAIEEGPPSIERSEDEERALPGILRRVREAEDSGVDAVVVACVGDVGVAEARRMVSIPVIGPGESAMQLAGTWGGRFSILVATEVGIEGMWRLVKRLDFEGHTASVRPLGVPILELQEKLGRTLEALGRESTLAAQEDGADTLIMGCTLAAGTERALRRRLQAHNRSLRVIEPLSWSVVFAEGVARSWRGGKASHS